MEKQILVEKELLDVDEKMHEYLEWEEDYAEKQAEFYERSI